MVNHCWKWSFGFDVRIKTRWRQRLAHVKSAPRVAVVRSIVRLVAPICSHVGCIRRQAYALVQPVSDIVAIDLRAINRD
jgi:hypothetical protein